MFDYLTKIITSTKIDNGSDIMSKNRLHIMKKAMQITLPLTLAFSMTACGKQNGFDREDVQEATTETTPDSSSEESILNSTVEIVPETPVENFSDENEVVNYFEKINQNLDQVFTKENFAQFKEMSKEKIFKSMILSVEFLSNNQAIGGYYFKDLTEPAKAKVMEIIDCIDQKIIQYYPDYKEYVLKKWNISYEAFQSFLDVSKQKIREILGEDRYDAIVGTKDKVKEKVKKKTNDWENDIKKWYQEKKEDYQ